MNAMSKRDYQHHLPDLSQHTVTTQRPVSYSFGFTGPSGWSDWAIFTVNDATGEFHIQSAWGDYQYRWSTDPNAIGNRTLTEFLAQNNDAYYVADKLHYGRRHEREEFDEDATKKAVFKRIAELYRDGHIDLEEAREMVYEAKHEVDWSNEELFLDSFYNEEALKKHIEEPYEYVETRPTFGMVLLTERLLPFFFDYLRREVLKEQAA